MTSPEAHPIIGPVPAGHDPDGYDRLRRRILWMLPTGLYVVGSRAGARRNLMTVSWVTQVAMVPKLVGIGVEVGALTRELISEGGAFALSILGRDERPLVRRYAKPVSDVSVGDDGRGTMQGAPVHGAVTGAPILDVAVAWLDCELRHTLALGSHAWFVGEVVDCALASGDVSEGAPPAAADTDTEVLRMEDTRMNYGG